MTEKVEQLLALAARCEAAEGPDRELDAEISLSCQTKSERMALEGDSWPPAYTASIDAAMLLHNGWYHLYHFEDCRDSATVGFGDDDPAGKGYGATPALALTAAALRARAALTGEPS